MALEQVGVTFIAAGGDVYITTLNSATSSTNTFVDATEKGGGRVSGAGQVMIGALRQIGSMAVQAFEQAAKATATFVGDSIKVAGDFEAGMNKFQAVAGKGVDTAGLAKFKDLFITLGKELPVSTSEVESAAIEMVSGGIDPAIVAGGALRQTIQFAAASGLSLADAAKTSAKFLAGWTSSAATTTEKVDFLTLSTDVLTKAAAASSTTAAELRLGLFNVQGAAQALHASFTDTTATLALLAPAFESSAQAGTALNVFMTRLEPQTKPAIAAMQDLGIITKDNQNLFFDAQGGFLGMGNAAQVLKEHMSGLSDEQKISQLHTLFGNDAMKVGNLLMQDGAAGIDGMKTKMDEANGVQATAKLMQEGYNTALENAKGSVEALQITIGSALLPILTDLMNNTIAPAVNTLTDMASALMGNNDAFNKLSPAMQGVVTTIGVLVADVQEIVGVFDRAGAGTAGFAMKIGDLANDLGLPGKQIESIILTVQNLVGWFTTAGDKSKSLGTVINDLNGIWNLSLKVVSDVGNGYMAIAQAVLPIIQKLWLDHGTEITAFLKTTYDSVISIVRLALQLYDAIVPPILQAIAGFFRDHASEVAKVLTGAGQAFGAIVTGTMETIKGIFQLALDLIHGDWSKAWGDIQTIVSAQGTAISGAIKGLLDMIAGIFNTNMADILALWQHNWDTALDIIKRVDWAQVGQDVVQGILTGLRDNWDSLTSWLTNRAHDMVNSALAAIGAHSPATAFMPVGSYAIEGIMAGMANMTPALIDLVNQTGTGMIDALTKNIQAGGDAIRKQMDVLVGDIKSIAAEINAAIADAFGATASIDRQMAKNLEDLQKIDPALQAMTSYRLHAAQQEAQAIADPVEGAKLYQLRSKQIMELAKLETELAAAQQTVVDTTNAQLAPDVTNAQQDAAIAARQAAMQKIALLQQQIALETAAQGAENSQFNANAAAQQSPVKAIADQISALFSGSDLANALPGILESPVMRQISGLLDQLRNTSASPAPSAQQMTGGNAGWQSYDQSRTYNMPIYTNQSPAAIQDSMALANASMP